jgi:drug/metabolite transporter (DMT)-like permease
MVSEKWGGERLEGIKASNSSTQKQALAEKENQERKAILLSTFLGSYLALILWIIGFQQTKASTASVLNQSSVLFTLVFAAWILKEPMGRRKWIGASLGFAGVAVIFLVP